MHHLEGMCTHTIPLLEAKSANCGVLSKDLLVAASEGDVTEASRLIEAGADVDATDSRGNTPLVLAAAAGHVSVLR